MLKKTEEKRKRKEKSHKCCCEVKALVTDDPTTLFSSPI
jgi:hypothetical protein